MLKIFEKSQHQPKRKKTWLFTLLPKIVSFLGLVGEERDLATIIPWWVTLRSQQRPVPGCRGLRWVQYVRCSQVSPSQPGRQRQVPRTWSQPAAFLQLHTWWQSSPKNPSGQAENAKRQFLAKFSYVHTYTYIRYIIIVSWTIIKL